MVFIPKDERIKNLLERLVRDRVTETDTKLAFQLSRYKQIQRIRNENPPQIYIALDRKTGKSVIFFKKSIKRKGNGFIL